MTWLYPRLARSSAGGRLYDAIHESGHFGALPEASQTTAQFVLVPVATLAGRVDLHGHSLSGRVGPPLHPGQVRIAINWRVQ